jgi:hypothetical protein
MRRVGLVDFGLPRDPRYTTQLLGGKVCFSRADMTSKGGSR